MFDDNVTRILNLMKDTFKGGPFKAFYDGDPEAIPNFNLPALVVDQTRDTTVKGAIGQDDISDEIVIKVIFNIRDDFDNDKVKQEGTTARKIRDIIAERDTQTGDYLPTTVKGALRQYATQGITALANEVQVDYGLLLRPEDVLTIEGHVTFSIDYSVDVDEAI